MRKFVEISSLIVVAVFAIAALSMALKQYRRAVVKFAWVKPGLCHGSEIHDATDPD